MITIVSYHGYDDIVNICKLCRRHRLWDRKITENGFRDIYNTPSIIECLAVALKDDKPCGSSMCLLDTDSGWNLGVYVQPKHRGQGIGEQLIRRVLKETRWGKYRVYSSGQRSWYYKQFGRLKDGVLRVR